MSEELKQQFDKLYDSLPPFGDREIDARVKKFTIQFALSCASQVCEQREKDRDSEIARWQQRIYEVCREVYPEVDGGGCDSGDELDFSIAEIEQTFALLEDKAESDLAQARQQAIAECAEIAEKHPAWETGIPMDIAERIRSLTPPPALTPTCIGYEGGCDGNLTGEPHEANCPMFAPPALTKETK